MSAVASVHPSETGEKTTEKTAVKERRVVVTGMGVVSCLGHDANTFYDNLLDGKSGITPIEGFDVSDFPTVQILSQLAIIIDCVARSFLPEFVDGVIKLLIVPENCW